MQWFKNRIDAKILIEEFRRQFNEVRPHSSLEQLTPAEFKRSDINNQPSNSHFLREEWSEESRQVRASDVRQTSRSKIDFIGAPGRSYARKRQFL